MLRNHQKVFLLMENSVIQKWEWEEKTAVSKDPFSLTESTLQIICGGAKRN